MNWAHKEAGLGWIRLIEMCRENGYQQTSNLALTLIGQF